MNVAGKVIFSQTCVILFRGVSPSWRGGFVCRGFLLKEGVGQTPSSPEIATDVVGTHPTGMHSC